MYRLPTDSTLSYVTAHEVSVNPIENSENLEVRIHGHYTGLLFPTYENDGRYIACIIRSADNFVHLPAMSLSDAFTEVARTLGAMPQRN